MNRHCTKCRPISSFECNHNILNDDCTLQPYRTLRLKKEEKPQKNKPFTHCGVCHNDFNYYGEIVK